MGTKRSILIRLLLLPVRLVLVCSAILFFLVTILVGEENAGDRFLGWVGHFGIYKGDK